MVQLRFQFGDRRDGGRGLRAVPIYALTDWRADSNDDGSLTFRPSRRTVWRRLGVTVVAGIFLGLVIWSGGVPWQRAEADPRAVIQDAVDDLTVETVQEVLEQQIPEERRQEFEKDVERIKEEHRQRVEAQRAELGLMRRIGRAVHWVLFVGAIAFGVLPLLLAAWERVDLSNGPDGELIVRRRRFLNREQRWPRGAFGGALCGVVERTHRPRRGWAQHLGWFWQIQLLPRHEQGGSKSVQFVDDPVVEFHVARQPDRPVEGVAPPKRVRAFLKHICRLTEIEPRDVQFGTVADPMPPHRGFWERRRPRVRTQTVTYESEPVVESATLSSMDELPADVQQRVRELRRQGIPPEGISEESVRITIRDADGNEQTYTSLDDLPAEVRAMYDAARRKRGRG